MPLANNPDINLDNTNIDQYIQHVYAVARARKEAQPEFCEIDFFMGASVMFDLLGRMDLMPAAWVFNPMRGVPILEDENTTE